MRAFLAAALLVTARAVSAQCSPAVQKLLNDRKYDDARSEAQIALRANASDDVALHCMGYVALAANKPGDAIDWFEKAIKANDNVSAHHLWLGNALGEQASHTAKIKLPFLARRVKSEFERASQLDPTSIEARHGLIQFYSQAPGVMGGSMEKAKEQAIEIGKLSAMRGHFEMASLLERDKDVAGAEREYSAALAAAPDSNSAYNGLAGFYRRQKRFAEAVVVYERLLKAKPDAVNARLNIGITFVQSGQSLDRAEREIRQWLDQAPKDAAAPNVSVAHQFLGVVYEKQAKKEQARAEYQAAVTANPKNEEAKKALAALK